MAYFSGQGRVFIGARTSGGNPAGLNFVAARPSIAPSHPATPGLSLRGLHGQRTR